MIVERSELLKLSWIMKNGYFVKWSGILAVMYFIDVILTFQVLGFSGLSKGHFRETNPISNFLYGCGLPGWLSIFSVAVFWIFFYSSLAYYSFVVYSPDYTGMEGCSSKSVFSRILYLSGLLPKRRHAGWSRKAAVRNMFMLVFNLYCLFAFGNILGEKIVVLFSNLMTAVAAHGDNFSYVYGEGVSEMVFDEKFIGKSWLNGISAVWCSWRHSYPYDSLFLRETAGCISGLLMVFRYYVSGKDFNRDC